MMKLALAFALTPLLIGATAPLQTQSLRDAMLEVHNRARAEVGTAPLVWSDELAANALAYAKEIAATDKFEHALRNKRVGQGENLWMGSVGGWGFAAMAADWEAEKANYVYKPEPDSSKNGGVVGHYTQMIWWQTTQVGCGVASSATNDYLVCRYTVPGNLAGESAYPAK